MEEMKCGRRGISGDRSADCEAASARVQAPYYISRTSSTFNSAADIMEGHNKRAIREATVHYA